MRIQNPNPTITLSVTEVADAVDLYVRSANQMPDSKRLGNLVHADLTTLTNVVGTSRQSGQLTFELLPESTA